MVAPDLSNNDWIVYAAFEIHKENGGVSFTEWELTVKAWELCKTRFGMTGFEDKYPNHKSVMTTIMNRKSRSAPLNKGFIQRVKQNTYFLTEVGVSYALTICDSKELDIVEVEHKRDIGLYDKLATFMRDRTYMNWRDGDRTKVTRSWVDFQAFFQFSTNETHVVDRALSRYGEVIKQVDKFFEGHPNGVFSRNMVPSDDIHSYSESDVDDLKEFKAQLMEQFSDYLVQVGCKE